MATTRRNKFDSVERMLAGLQPSYPIYCLRPHIFRHTVSMFLEHFPGKTMFAVKCNPHPAVLKFLYEAGIRHFDTASIQEISQISELFPEATLYYMHPVKPRAHISMAHDVYQVRHYVIDHINELKKIQEEIDTTQITVMVRIATPGSGARFDLSEKFGAQPEEAVELLRLIAAAGMQTGLAFHVGSQCTTTSAFEKALAVVRTILDKANVRLKYLDIGGGFPAHYEGTNIPALQDYFESIKSGLSALALPDNCELMCEPGRALVADGCSLVVQVQLRKDHSLYINDGIYGSFSEAHSGGFHFPARLVRLDNKMSSHMEEFSIFGPTCDSTDKLPYTFILPSDIKEGDWIEVDKLGAYSNACATRFNGFFPETFVEIHDV